MTRFPAVPFVMSIVVTAALAGALWHARESRLSTLTTSVAPAPEAPRSVRPPPQPGDADGGAKFAEFQERVSDMDVAYLDTLDANAVASLATSAASITESDPNYGGHIDVLAGRWMELDPAGALEWARSLPQGKLKRVALHATLIAWAEANPKEAIEWFTARTGRRPREIPKGDAAMKEEWGGAAAELARMDNRPLEAIMADVTALPVEERMHPAQNSVYYKLVEEWEHAVRDNGQGSKALALISADQPLGDMTCNFINPPLEEMLPENPAGAMAWLEKHPSVWSEEYLNWLFSIPKDPGDGDDAAAIAAWPPAEEVAAWFLRIHRPYGDTPALAVLTDAWARVDPDAAGAYLNRQPAGPDKDAAVHCLALWMADANPDAALKWAVTIRDEAARAEARKDVLTRWRHYDPVEAEAWEAGADEGGEE